MRILLLIVCLLLIACPKQTETKSIEDKEREQRLQELLEEEDFDDIPEASERDEPSNASD